MKIRLVLLSLLIQTVAFGDISDTLTNYPNSNNYLDIIVDDTHAYTYLKCSNDRGGLPYSIYSSLMPKKEEDREGVEDFPKILQLLFEAGDFLTESTTGISLYPKECSASPDNHQAFTFRDLMDACRFGFCYMISDYLKTSVEGKIITDQPDPEAIKLRKRFYLTANQARQAIALINNNFKKSSEGKIIYDSLNHNCVDYVKEIYEGIGLTSSYGEFLSQFGLGPNASFFDDEESLDDSACMMLKAYKIHNEGAIDLRKVLTVIKNAARSFLGLD